eukprot:TRINITY_DN5736_c0_g2_i3.p1 TRINITY_DN5736_c0_g2~~TRINITY_DN5736_c0_g2_i3.p1  ORF type:complete len:272 (-),score=56.24 TRINITY_DN5736_c0_g2_i3:242-1057(-)
MGIPGLKVGDVVLAVDGFPVGHDGKVALDLKQVSKLKLNSEGAGGGSFENQGEIAAHGDCRVSLWYLFFQKPTGSRCQLTAKTPPDGADRTIEFELSPYDPIIPEDPEHPSGTDYLVVAGLVFQVLSQMYMTDAQGWESFYLKEAFQSLWSRSWDKDAQIVVLSDVLAHPCNKGLYGGYTLLKKFNGQPILNLAEFSEKLDAQIASGGWLTFEFSDEVIFAVETAEAIAATETVLLQYSLALDRRIHSATKDVASLKDPSAEQAAQSPEDC